MKQKKAKQPISLSIEHDLWVRLQKWAKAEGIGIAAYVRRLIIREGERVELVGHPRRTARLDKAFNDHDELTPDALDSVLEAKK